MSKKQIKLSVIVPAYNEEQIIESTLIDFSKFLDSKRYQWELIVVDDGSKDKTAIIVNKLSKKLNNLRLVSLKVNSGKGAAIREGVKAAVGEYIIFSDADLSVPIAMIDTFLVNLEAGSDIVIGSRRTAGSLIKVHQPWIRENMGRVFTLLTRLMLNSTVSDFTCGFKGFSNHAAKDIFGKSQLDRWAYDAEIMFLAGKRKYKIVEIPVSWVNRANSRVAVGNAAITSLIDLFRIRLFDLLGKYNA